MARRKVELSTIREPVVIAIDGVDYELADPGALSLVQVAALRRLTKVYSEISSADEVDEARAREGDEAMRSAFAIIAPSVPQEIAAKLSIRQMGQVTEVFFLALAEATSGQNSSPSSPGSSASTEGVSSLG